MVTTLYKHTQMATEIFSLSLSFLFSFDLKWKKILVINGLNLV